MPWDATTLHELDWSTAGPGAMRRLCGGGEESIFQPGYAPDGELTFVDDQRGSPTCTADLALLLRDLAVDRRPGTFHATNQGNTNWYEFTRAALTAAGQDARRVHPIATADLDPPRPATRPANSILDNAALRAAGVPLMPDWHEALERTVRSLIA